VVVTTNGGTGWAQQLGLPANSLYAISCPSTTVCFAVGFGGEVAVTANGGTAWSTQTSGTTQNLYSISCPSTSACFATGNGGTVIATANGGASWSAQTSNTGDPLGAISCSGTATCFAVTNGSNFIKTVNGSTWSLPATVGAATGLTGISCPSATTCFATDPAFSQIYTTADGGTTWQWSFTLGNDPQAGTNGQFKAIGCPSTTTCYAVGTLGVVATTTDGGANWRTDDPGSQATLTGVSCPSGGTCYVSALDSTILHTTDFGRTWDVQMGLNSYTSVSCPSSTVCFAVGYGGANPGNASVTTTSGAAWTRPLPAGTTTLLAGVSCTSASDCYAAANDSMLVTHNAGSTWTAHVMDGTDVVDAVSCPAANTCFAAGWPGAIYFTGDGGTTWTRQAHSLYGSDNTFLGVSCASRTICVAVGTHGTVMSTSNGTTWATETSGTTILLRGVSCPTSYSCIAVGIQGLTMTRTSGAWQAYPSGTTQNLHGVSCPAVSICYAVGNAGTVLLTSNRGGNWATQTSSTVADLYGVSCTQTSACLAAGNFSATIVTLDGSNWSRLRTPSGTYLRAAFLQDLQHAWVTGFGGTILANSTLTPYTCPSVSASATPPSPSFPGIPVAFTGIASGCPNPLYQFWIQPPGSSTWLVAQAYSSTATFNWGTTGLAAGLYYFAVWVVDASSSGISCSSLGCNDAFTAISYTLRSTACTSVTASAAPASPQLPGTPVTLTAVASGCPSPLYQFWIQYTVSTTWWNLQAYSSSATFNWNTTGLPAGLYHFSVWVRDAGSSGTSCSSLGCNDAFAAINYTLGSPTCASVAASAAPPSPSVPGTAVTFTAAASGCPNPLYEFWMLAPGSGAWTVARAYSSLATFNWNTNGLSAGLYHFSVWVRDSSSTGTSCNSLGCLDAFSAMNYTLGSPTCASVTASAAPTSPQLAGTAVTFTGVASGCPTPLYEFWMLAPGSSTWTVARAYSSTAMFIWSTTGLAGGTYYFAVWVRDASSSGTSCNSLGCLDAYTAVSYTLTSTPCTSVTASPAPPSPSVHGTAVTFTGVATGCPSPVYEFWILAPGSSTWMLAQAYSPSATFNWSTTGLPAGTYHFSVWVRDSSSAGTTSTSLGTFDAFVGASYTLT